MNYIHFDLDVQRGPMYSGFWIPGTSGESDYLTNHCMVRVVSGRYYWLTGFPENTLPPRCDGEKGIFSSVAKATVLKYKEGKRWDGDLVYMGTEDPSIFAFAKLNGKLHILYEETTYPIHYRRTSMTEIDMYRSWA
ncbi:MAG: hypothetical protein EB075_09320 [Bacteroidetes bacterium]|nr:hypothetical protein [Bacteroidota bacterium]